LGKENNPSAVIFIARFNLFRDLSSSLWQRKNLQINKELRHSEQENFLGFSVVSGSCAAMVFRTQLEYGYDREIYS
jgi:hypothetical protein